jgi:hypothetical protein
MILKKANILPIILALITGGVISSIAVLSYFKYIQSNNLSAFNKTPQFNLESSTLKENLNSEEVNNLTSNLTNVQNSSFQEISYQEINRNTNSLKTQSTKNKLENQNKNKTKTLSNSSQINDNNQNLLANFLVFLSKINQSNNQNLTSNNYSTSTSNYNTSSNNQNNQSQNNQNQNRNNSNNNQNNSNNQSNNQNNNQNNNSQNNNNNNNNNNENDDNENINLGNQSSGTKILISEILIDGGSANDEFVELYNPNNFSVNLTGWKLVKFNKNNNQQTLIGQRTRNTFSNKIIPPYSYLLIANETGSYAQQADLVYSESYNLAKDNSLVLINNNNEVVDLVGWGSAPRYESNAFSQNPGQGVSLVRKAGFESTQESMVSNEINFGNSLDTDNNNFDFVLLNPEPQNSRSQAEQPPQEIRLINFDNTENNLIFEIISPYRISNNSRYVLLTFNIEDNQDIDNYLRTNWQNLSLNYTLPAVERNGKRQTIQVTINNQENNESDENEQIYLLGLVVDNQLINWVPDLND